MHVLKADQIKNCCTRNSKNTIDRIKNSFSPEITRPISTKFTKKHSWVKGIQICSNNGTHPDNNELAKMHRRNIKVQPITWYKNRSLLA